MILVDFKCPITFEPLNFGHYVFKRLFHSHSSFYMDTWHLYPNAVSNILFCADFAEAQRVNNREYVNVQMIWTLTRYNVRGSDEPKKYDQTLQSPQAHKFTILVHYHCSY